MNKWKKVGVVGVDSGQILICDPCYLDRDGLPKIWSATEVYRFNEGKMQLHFDSHVPGLAMIVDTQVGDGMFDVCLKENEDGTIEIKIKFE